MPTAHRQTCLYTYTVLAIRLLQKKYITIEFKFDDLFKYPQVHTEAGHHQQTTRGKFKAKASLSTKVVNLMRCSVADGE